MSNEYLKIKLKENLVLKIWNDEADIFYDDCFEGFSLIINENSHYSCGKKSKMMSYRNYELIKEKLKDIA